MAGFKGWSSLGKEQILRTLSELSVSVGDLTFSLPMTGHSFLTDDHMVERTTFGEDVTPDWGPDNLGLVFASQRSGDRRWQVYLGWADAKSEAVPLVEGRTPAWSPDGVHIAYQGADEQGNNPGLYLISVAGGPGTRLTDGESERAPAWSPACARWACAW